MVLTRNHIAFSKKIRWSDIHEIINGFSWFFKILEASIDSVHVFMVVGFQSFPWLSFKFLIGSFMRHLGELLKFNQLLSSDLDDFVLADVDELVDTVKNWVDDVSSSSFFSHDLAINALTNWSKTLLLRILEVTLSLILRSQSQQLHLVTFSTKHWSFAWMDWLKNS